jgi:hypothetical protein
MPVDVVHIRPPRLKDAPALAAAYEEAWRNAYQGIIPHLSLQRMIARRGLRWWETALRKRTPLLVLDFGGEAAGCDRGAAAHAVQAVRLYLHPVYQGSAWGEALRAPAVGPPNQAQRLLVWALADNDAACGAPRLGGKRTRAPKASAMSRCARWPSPGHESQSCLSPPSPRQRRVRRNSSGDL